MSFAGEMGEGRFFFLTGYILEILVLRMVLASCIEERIGSVVGGENVGCGGESWGEDCLLLCFLLQRFESLLLAPRWVS